MSWKEQELDVIGRAVELRVTTNRPDGRARQSVPIWVVRVDDDLYVRSYRGVSSSWFTHATEDGHGHIESGGVSRDVDFERVADTSVAGLIDAEYERKYARFGDAYVQPMIAPDAQAATLRLVPQ